jgi:sulfur carrier protein ThiS
LGNAVLVTATTVPQGSRATRELSDGATAHDLVRDLGMPAAASLVLRNGRPIPIDEPLADGDELEVIYVASGG